MSRDDSTNEVFANASPSASARDAANGHWSARPASRSPGWRLPLGAHVLADGRGVELAVWAPGRRQVTVEWHGPGERGGSVPLANDAGTWRVVLPEAAAGTRYQFRLDGGPPLFDPYGRSLPEGINGPSEVIDPTDFAWHDSEWPGLTLDGLVIYEVHIGTFSASGTFDGAVAELDGLVDLGVRAIELMPVSTFPGRWNWGYDGVAHYAPAAVYGGPDGLRRLVDAAHQRGLGVILDVVYNHLGPAGNNLRAFAPDHFTDRYRTPWGDALNYDGPGSRQVRDWAIDNACYWLAEYHLDGLRLDATAEIHDAGEPHVLRELAERARAVARRPIVLIAEDNRNDVRLVRSTDDGGYGLDAIWADDFHHALRTLLTDQREGYYAAYGGSAAEMVDVLRHGLLYRGQVSPVTGKPRGRPTDQTPARAFVFCLENHDQVGNRAHGERLAHLVSPAAYRAASALLLLAPETPMLFMGQEFAATTPFQYFTDHEPELGRLVTEGRRREFAAFTAFANDPEAIPDPQDERTFQRSKLRPEDRLRHADMLRLYRDVIALRRHDEALRAQDRLAFAVAPIGDRAVGFRCGAGEAERLVVANFGGTLDVEVPEALAVAGSWRARLSTDDQVYGGGGARVEVAGGRLRMPPDCAAVFAPHLHGV